MITEYLEDPAHYTRACRIARMSWGKEHASDDGGPLDQALAVKLAKAGSDHSAAFRQAVVFCKVTASRGWWQHMSKYRVGMEMYSTSLMHTGTRQEYTRDMFRNGNLIPDSTIASLNQAAQNKDLEQLTTIMPESYLQTRSIMMSYPLMRSIYQARYKHRKPEWREFLDELLKNVLYPEFITE